MSDLTQPLRVYYGRNRKINLYIYHPIFYNTAASKKSANENRRLVNWVRKMFPHVMNEMRELPAMYDKNGSCGWHDTIFCFYGLTKQEYMMLKLSWTFKEFRLNGTKPTGKQRRINYISPYYCSPSRDCCTRFSKPNYKPKPLKVLD